MALGLTVTTVVLLIFNVVLGETAGWVAAGCMLDVLHAQLAGPAAAGLALPLAPQRRELRRQHRGRQHRGRQPRGPRH